MEIIKPKPIPPSTLFPRRMAISPIGALDAPAAAIPVTVDVVVPLVTVPTNFSLTIKLAAKYSKR
jgi:hypothetical protein